MSATSAGDERQQVLRRALLELKEMRARLEALERAKTEPIAVIGVGCRFPGGANTPEAFWQLMRTGRDGIREIPADRWDVEAYYDPDPEKPGKIYTRRGGFLDEVDRFDPLFFGIAPREAVSMDPQHRLFLEVSWEALEHAGIAPDTLYGSQTGVFVGITANDYAQLCLKVGDISALDAYVGTGNPLHFAAGRLSHILGLHGPSMAVDTACSSSLVAVHLACQSLRLGESDLALVGGVNLILSPETTLTLAKARMLAVDGRCKTFDAAADGYGRGEGCGVVVLKRHSDAVAAADPILALIRGSAVNQDGPSSGLTVPNAFAQQRLIRTALANAGVAPGQVHYIETHGTGTPLGDPIELRSLAAVLGEGRPTTQPVIIGTVKTNIGHLESAAGIAGLIKVVLALQHEEIPPHLHLQEPNPHLAWDELPLVVPTARMPWLSRDQRRIAGVSSFGVSGTNAHVVLEEAPRDAAISADSSAARAQLLTLSAQNAPALGELAQRFAEYVATHPATSLPDICYTTHVGRTHFTHRLAVVADTPVQMRDQLMAYASGHTPSGVLHGQGRRSDRQKVAFLFTGQGAQYVGMGRQLYDSQPLFRQTLDQCDALLRPYLDVPLLEVLYPAPGATSPLDETAYTQPALFALEYALTALWRSWGIEPAAVMGHSVGEYVAACVASVFSLDDGLKLIAERGRLMQALPRDGEMAAVFADEARVAAALAPYTASVSIAAINGPQETVISGEREALQAVLAVLHSAGIETRRLRVSHAFHSPQMEAMLDDFAPAVAAVGLAAPQIGVISNLTGQLVQADEMVTAKYWQRHAREAVRFAAGMQTLHEQGYTLFVEIGPSPTLSGMGRRCVPEGGQKWLPSLRQGRDDWRQLLESLGVLYVQGLAVDWTRVDGDAPRHRVALPTYPFQRQRYWIDMIAPDHRSTPPQAYVQSPGHHPLLGQRLSSPLPQIQFESQLSMHSVSLVKDHRVHDVVVVPGVVYIEMALAGVQDVFETDAFVLEELTLQQPLILDEDNMWTVQLILRSEDAGAITFQLFSRPPHIDDERTAWRLHAHGRLRHGQDEPPSIRTRDMLEAIRSRCRARLSGAAFYETVWPQAFHLGPHFRCIEQLWWREGEALGQMRAPDVLAAEAGAPGVRPDLLVMDACVQLLLAALPREAREAAVAGQSVYIGTGQECSRVYERFPSGPLWCQALTRQSENYQETFVGDLRLFNDTGRMLAEIVGVCFKRVGRESLQRLAHLSQAASQAQKGSLSRDDIRAAALGERQRMVEHYVAEELARVLGLSPSELEQVESLHTLMDSLMIIELKNRIESNLQVVVPVSAFFEDNSIAQLAALVLEQLTTETSPLPHSLAEVDEAPLEQLLAELEQLSEDEVEARLRLEKRLPEMGDTDE